MAAAHSMSHRGPDGEGYLLLNRATGLCSLRNGPDTPPDVQHPPLKSPTDFTPNLILAHRRLAIIDLSPGGHEPMTVPGQDYWITFNGEIYNYLERSAELQALGYTFRTESDVKFCFMPTVPGVTLAPGSLHRHVRVCPLGSAAYRRLVCARDRFGVKPFYYAVNDATFAFASEIKALLPIVPARANPTWSSCFPSPFWSGLQCTGHILYRRSGTSRRSLSARRGRRRGCTHLLVGRGS